MISFRLNKVRAHRVLVVIRPAGTGWLHRLRSQRSGEPGGERICPARNARRGNCFRRTVAAMKPEAQPRPARIHNNTRTPWAEPPPKGDMATSASPHEGFSGTPLTRQGRSQRQAGTPLAHAAPCLRRRGAPSKAGRRREPSFVTHRQRTASVEDGTHSHNLPQQAPAHPPSTAQRRGVGLADRRCRFGGIEGRQATRGGDGPQGFPWRQAQRAVPQARRQLDEESCRPHIATPPPECQRRRRRDVRQHRARPPPRPDF
jgi:hypothetical protein